MADYRVVDIRGRFGPADGTWGTRPKGLGVVLHYNGGPVPERAWRDPVAWIKFITGLHSQRGRFASGWLFRGCAYHEFIFGRTVYRVMNWRADTPHCGNSRWNRNALGLHIPVGGSQRPRQAGDGTMITALQRADDHLRAMGRPRSALVGHREVGSSLCPGDPIMASIRNYRAEASVGDPGKGSGGEAPEPADTVFRVIAGSFSDRAGANRRAAELQSAGFGTPWIYQYGQYWRVQVAAFSDQKSADEVVERLKAARFEAYALAEAPDPKESAR